MSTAEGFFYFRLLMILVYLIMNLYLTTIFSTFSLSRV